MLSVLVNSKHTSTSTPLQDRSEARRADTPVFGPGFQQTRQLLLETVGSQEPSVSMWDYLSEPRSVAVAEETEPGKVTTAPQWMRGNIRRWSVQDEQAN